MVSKNGNRIFGNALNLLRILLIFLLFRDPLGEYIFGRGLITIKIYYVKEPWSRLLAEMCLEEL